MLADPAWREPFKQALGYDLPVPPRTWQQVLDIATFFDGKDWDAGDASPDHGMVLHLKPGEQGHFHFQSLAAAFAITPGETLDSTHNVFWFDPETMKPLIDSPGNVAALEMLQALAETGPEEQLGWRLPEAWSYFLRGKAVFTFSFGDLGALCQDRAVSRVQGKCGVAILPGSNRHWDYATKQWVETPDPAPVGNTTGGSWQGVVTSGAKEPEAAYAFLSLMAIPPVSLWSVEHGWTGVNPGMTYQFLPPDGTARLADYVKAGWNRADVEDYLRAYHATFTAPTMLPYLRIRGTPEYWSALDTEIAAAMGGRKTPAEALGAWRPPGRRSPIASAGRSSSSCISRPSATGPAEPRPPVRETPEMITTDQLRRLFPEADEFPAEYPAPAPVHQRSWLIDGQLGPGTARARRCCPPSACAAPTEA